MPNQYLRPYKTRSECSRTSTTATTARCITHIATHTVHHIIGSTKATRIHVATKTALTGWTTKTATHTIRTATKTAAATAKVIHASLITETATAEISAAHRTTRTAKASIIATKITWASKRSATATKITASKTIAATIETTVIISPRIYEWIVTSTTAAAAIVTTTIIIAAITATSAITRGTTTAWNITIAAIFVGVHTILGASTTNAIHPLFYVTEHTKRSMNSNVYRAVHATEVNTELIGREKF
uniref:Uncharacterized protein n=1 Tax=Glossina brevipalpis TaxID=37001 RepID=A0A1A9WNX3_9MUSC